MINTATQAQWDEIDTLKSQVIDSTTDQYSDDEISEVVCQMYQSMDLDTPTVLVAPSPFAMLQRAKELQAKQGDSKEDIPWYCGTWWRAWSGWYAGAKILGVEFDEEKLDLFTKFNERASVWCAFTTLCIVAKNPIKVHWQDGVLHNVNGMSVEYSDGTGLWTIEGVAVDEQIVMSPESQTLEQIRSEENQEVKRIRIDRYGWPEYLKNSDASIVDEQTNDIDGTKEVLVKLSDDEMVAFIGTCRSTGRRYFLEVDPEITTCAEAHGWMTGDKKLNIVGAS